MNKNNYKDNQRYEPQSKLRGIKPVIEARPTKPRTKVSRHSRIKKEFTDLIILDLEGKTKEELLLNISKYAKEKGIVKDEKELYDAFIAREKLCSTGLGQGIAVPEARIIDMGRPYANILCRTKEPVDYNSLDGKSVRIISAFIYNSNLHGESHLKNIFNISRCFGPKKSFTRGFLKAKYINEVYRLFEQVDLVYKKEQASIDRWMIKNNIKSALCQQ